MNNSVPGIKVAMTGRSVIRFISLCAPILVYLILSNPAPSLSDNAAKGVLVVEFKTKAGLVKVFLPDDISAGDTVSASIALSPGGVTREAMDRNLGILNSYTIETSFFKVPASHKSIKINVPRNSAGTEMKFTLRDASMKTLHSASVPIKRSSSAQGGPETPSPYDYQCPLIGQAGRIVEIKGPFDGDFATTDFKIGSKKAYVLAESPRKLVFESPADIVGSVEVVLVERGVVVKRPFTCLQVLKIGEEDAVSVVSTSRTESSERNTAAVSEKRREEAGLTERELPPATRTLEFRSIKAEETLPSVEPAAETPAGMSVPSGRNEEIRIILVGQMESPVSVESSIYEGAPAPGTGSAAVTEENIPPVKADENDENREETLIEPEPEDVLEKAYVELPSQAADHAAAPGDAMTGSKARVIEAQMLASFSGDPAGEGVSDAGDSGARAMTRSKAGGGFTVQVASYREKGEAETLADRLTLKGYKPYVVPADLPGKGKWYRVRVGEFRTKREAASFGENLKRKERYIKSVYITEND